MEFPLGNNNLDIIVYGTLNMDFVCYVDRLPMIGETVTSRKFTKVPGGKAANQAVAASRLGANVAMVGRVGNDDIGQVLRQNLRNDKIDDEMVYITDNCMSGTAMINVDNQGQNTIVTNLGANACLTKEDIDQTKDKLSSAKLALLQLEIPLDSAEHIIKTAHQLKKKVLLNLAPVFSLDKNILQLVDLLIVNETEASHLVDIKVEDIKSAKMAAEKLTELGIENVIVTLGEAGAVLKSSDTLIHYPSPKVKAIDTTAAGDCFVAAVGWFWISEGSLTFAVQKAVEVAALSVKKQGAQPSLPTLEEYLQFKDQIQKVY